MLLNKIKQIKISKLESVKLVDNKLKLENKKGSFYSLYNPDLIYSKNKTFLSKSLIKNSKGLTKKSLSYSKTFEKSLAKFYNTNVVKLKVIGIGYRCYIKRLSDGKQILFLKFGYSHLDSIRVPNGISVIVFGPRKNFMRVIGKDKSRLMFFVGFLKKITPLNAYKAKGIFNLEQTFSLKAGKKS